MCLEYIILNYLIKYANNINTLKELFIVRHFYHLKKLPWLHS